MWQKIILHQPPRLFLVPEHEAMSSVPVYLLGSSDTNHCSWPDCPSQFDLEGSGSAPSEPSGPVGPVRGDGLSSHKATLPLHILSLLRALSGGGGGGGIGGGVVGAWTAHPLPSQQC